MLFCDCASRSNTALDSVSSTLPYITVLHDCASCKLGNRSTCRKDPTIVVSDFSEAL